MKYIVVGFKYKANGKSKDKWICTESKTEAFKTEEKWINKGYESVSVCVPISSTDYETHPVNIEDTEPNPQEKELCGLVIPEGYVAKTQGRIEEEDLLFTTHYRDYPNDPRHAEWKPPRLNSYGKPVYEFHAVITKTH